MATISLRDYIKKIENQIDNGQIDQAIAHCKYILKTFPKHIDSYRLLGKAFLEKEKYGDASDIFQRVLSSVPDDFISHIGMSIIREDENNLDAAIWHMERAFEVQPSNKAVQDELRRLYTNRDGVSPPKIRLTRGALVRMYTRGELYNQAIAEIKAALGEDSNRVDLEVVLARIYFILGQKVEATETCSKLISKLPYCYEANRILSEILPGTSREEDQKIFQQRVTDLDPYYKHVDEKTPAITDVPDSKIMMEYLDWEPGMSIDEQPDWAQSIGFNLEKENPLTEEITNWLGEIENLSSETNEPEPSENFEPDEIQEINLKDIQEVETQSEQTMNLSEKQEQKDEKEEIPDWMKEAGWEISSEENQDIEKGFTLPSSEKELTNFGEPDPESILATSPEDEILPAEIPDWLQGIAPKDSGFSLNEEEDQTDIEDLEDLFNNLEIEKNKTPETETSTSWENEFAEDEESQFNKTLQEPDFSSFVFEDDEKNKKLESFSESSLSEVKFESEIEEEDLLSWLTDDSPLDETNEKFQLEPDVFVNKEIENEIDSPAINQIINELKDETENEPEPINEDDWLNSLILDDESVESEPFAIKNEKEEIPDWIKSVIEEEEEEEEEGEEAKQTTELDATLPNWLSTERGSEEIIQDEIKISFNDEVDYEIPKDVVETPETSEEFLITEFEDDSSDSIEEFISILDKGKESTTETTFEKEESATDFDQDAEISSNLDQINFEDFKFEPQSETDLEPVTLESEEIASIQSDYEIEAQELTADDETTKIEEEKDEEVSLIDDKSEYMTEIDDSSMTEPEPPDEEDFEEYEEIHSVLEKIDTGTGKDSEDLPFDEDTDEEELKSALAWMEGLALKHGAEEETLVSKPEERSETPPDWITEESKLSQENKDSEDFDATPSWLKELEIETEKILPADTTPLQEEDEIIENLEVEEGLSDTIFSTKLEEIDVQQPSEDYSHELDTEEEEEGEEGEEKISSILSDFDELPAIEESGPTLLDEELQTEVIDLPPALENIDLEMKEKIDQLEEDDSISETIIEEINNMEEVATSELVGEFETEFSHESLVEAQEMDFVHAVEDEFEDTQPIKVKAHHQEDLEMAKQQLNSGKVEAAITTFRKLIEDGYQIEEVIETIQNALNHNYPIEINLWQTLGDAYLKNNQLQNALDAFSKAEDLLI